MSETDNQIHARTYKHETPEGTARVEIEMPGDGNQPDEKDVREAIHAWRVGDA